MLSASGDYLSDDSLCEILQACFRVCFETRLSGLLFDTKRVLFVFLEFLQTDFVLRAFASAFGHTVHL